MKSALARLSRAAAVAIVAIGALGAVVSADDPPTPDTPFYEECSATAASKDGDDKYEFDNCAGSCPEGQGPCTVQNCEIGGLKLIGCGCELNAGPTLSCCQLLISQDGTKVYASGECASCGLSGKCEKDTQVIGTHTAVYAVCE